MIERLESRLDLFVSSWPAVLRAAFYQYTRATQKRLSVVEAAYPKRLTLPYWHFMPGWILGANRKNQSLRNFSKHFLEDVLWGQYCLFLSVRVKDDLFDRQAHDPLLLFVGEQFALEAERVYSTYFFKSDSFWKFYRKFLRETIEGIVEVNAFQRGRWHKRRRLLEAYARVSAIFKVGSVAVCLRTRRAGLLPSIQRTLDELAIAGQILDDFMDIAEDYKQNRINFAASVFLDAGSKDHKRSGNDLKQIVRGFLQTDAEERVFTIISQHLANALEEAKQLRLPPLERMILHYQQSIQLIEKSVYQGRVKRIFSL